MTTKNKRKISYDIYEIMEANNNIICNNETARHYASTVPEG